MSPELEAAIAAARAAGRIQRRRFRRQLLVEMKADQTPVTAADWDSEALIRRMLAPVLPGCPFLAEESSPQHSALSTQHSALWIVDPLDGTTKFVRGLPFFGPCIALEREGLVCLGVMHLPALGETLWAERGSGAFLNGQPIRVSTTSRLERAYVAYGYEGEFYQRDCGEALERLAHSVYHNPGFLELYSYAGLASGRIDAVVMLNEAPWDIAAAQVIIEEAGGRLTDFDGSPTIYGDTTLATNGILHQSLLELLQAYR